jgi:undecaprenyl-phosphate galactose phosphotransferase
MKYFSPAPVASRRSTGPASAPGRALIQTGLFMAGDTLAFVLAILAGAYLLGAFDAGASVSNYRRLSATGLLVLATALAWFGLELGHYTRRRPFWDELADIAKVLGSLTIFSAAMIFALKIATQRTAFVSAWAVAWLTLPLLRVAARRFLDRMGMWRSNLVIVGAGENARSTLVALLAAPGLGYRPVVALAVAFDERLGGDELGAGRVSIPIRELDSDLDRVLAAEGAGKVAVALEDWLSPDAQALTQHLALKYPDLLVVPPLKGLPLIGADVQHVFGREVLLLQLRHNLDRRTNRIVKRIFDLLAASLLILAFSPLMTYVAWRIWREDGGPVLFRQSRLGRFQGEFGFLKFRSMIQGADATLEQWKAQGSPLWQEYVESNFKLRDDPRVLRIGRWIRATSIDELPQLFNVLRGEMSLVGPRPLLARELPEYGESIEIYGRVRPGITGLWQVSGRSKTTFGERAMLDAWYVRNWSLWYDLVILFKTARVVLRREGAY